MKLSKKPYTKEKVFLWKSPTVFLYYIGEELGEKNYEPVKDHRTLSLFSILTFRRAQTGTIYYTTLFSSSDIYNTLGVKLFEVAMRVFFGLIKEYCRQSSSAGVDKVRKGSTSMGLTTTTTASKISQTCCSLD